MSGVELKQVATELAEGLRSWRSLGVPLFKNTVVFALKQDDQGKRKPW